MIKLNVVKLGTVCKDRATGLEGTVTHWVCSMSRNVEYLFQPKGLNPEDGQPVKKIFLESERLEVSADMLEDVEIPFEVLGTQVTNDPSGFTGMAINFVRHINGCFHVTIQPKGVLGKTNNPIRSTDFDLRECSGEMITKLNAGELAQSKQEHPSPTGDRFEKQMPTGTY